MPEITDERINRLRSSIHNLRIFLNYSNSMKNRSLVNDETEGGSKKFNEDKITKIESKVNIEKNITNKTSNKRLSKTNDNIEKNKLSNITDGKIQVLPGECVVNEGEKGDTAFLIISGSFNVEINKKVVGSMSSGDIFGELSLILGEKRKATVRAITGSELVEINSSFLDDYLLSSKANKEKMSKSKIEIQKLIKELSVELGKKDNQKLPIDIDKLEDVIKTETNIIQSLSRQLFKRLSKMIKDNEKNKKIV